MTEINKKNAQISGDAGAGVQKAMQVELTANSHKSKKLSPDVRGKKDTPERPKAERVVSNDGRVKKKGFGDKVKETFTGEDAKSVGNYIFFDVVIPAFKSMLADAASQGTERLLFGSSSSRSRPRDRERTPTAYNRMSFSGGSERVSGGREISRQDRATHNFDSVIVDSRPEAEEVLDRLAMGIEEYGSARVTDFYEMVGITGSFADDKWGWFNLRDSGVRRVREGYLILLPRPEVID